MRGPKPKGETVSWEIRLPVALAAKAELILLDPHTGQTAYGARSALVTRLLREWLAGPMNHIPEIEHASGT